MNTRIPIILCIDVEPDGFFIDRTQPLPWRGYEGAYRYFGGLREQFARVTRAPVHFNWFCRADQQVEETYGSAGWVFTHYSKLVEDLLEQGDEIGLHPHAYRWVPENNNWIEDLSNQEWVNHCIEMSFGSYKKLFGRGCDSFRFGACWMNSETIDLAERLGVRFDLTVEPGLKLKKRYFKNQLYSDGVPSHEGALRHPYRPSKTDFRKRDPEREAGLWMIPLSTGTVTYEYGRLETAFKKLFKPEDLKPRLLTLNLGRGNNGFASIMNELIHSLERPYLAMVVRSDACGDRPADPTHTENLKKNIDYILNHPLRDRFVFSTPAEAMEIMGYLKAGTEREGVPT